jgi:hypothetical protein
VLPPGVVPDNVIWDWDGAVGGGAGLGPHVVYWTTSGLKTVSLHVEVTTDGRDLDGWASIEVMVDSNLLEPGLEHNILGDWATFTVPAGDQRTVTGWRVEEQDQIDVSVRTGTGEPGSRTIDVHCAALDANSHGGAAYIYADMASGEGPAYYRAEKKWGKIDDTLLWPYEYYGRGIVPATTRSSDVVWNESLKKWEGGIYMVELVIGSYDTNEGLLEVPASGAIVHWWLLDGRADVSTIPASGNFADVAAAIDALPDANLVTFDTGGTTATTESGDGGYRGLAPGEGMTGMSVEAWGEESVIIVVVAEYKDGLSQGGQYPVSPEIETWNFWTQQVEKVPQVRWAGDEIILEKYFGTVYNEFDVNFVLEQQSPGALASVTDPNDNRDANARSIWTTVVNGTAQCDLISEDQGEVDVDCLLYDESGNLINKHGFVVFYLKLEEISLTNVLGDRVDNPLTEAIEGHDSGLFLPDDRESQEYGPWDVNLDSTTDEKNVSADMLLRARVKGWFMGDNLSGRAEKVIDVDPYYDSDGDGIADNDADVTLPKGRWVLPDDWRTLAGPNWERLRPHWDIMDQPNDDVMSLMDGVRYWDPVLMEWVLVAQADKAEELGPYYPWVTNPYTGVSTIAGPPVAMAPVIGPYSSLDTYTAAVRIPILDRKTIVSNGQLNWWDCPMPPAKVLFEITGATDIGYFKEVDKGDVYYHLEDIDGVVNPFNPTDTKDTILYTNPYYATMIPASPLIPPFINNGGYDWNSAVYGPYDFWTFINQPAQGIPDDPTHPTMVEVYSDNHGEAMVWLNGDWNLDTSAPGVMFDQIWKDWTEMASMDPANPPVVGNTTVVATADYPYLRKHQAMMSGEVEKAWTWGKEKIVDVFQLLPVEEGLQNGTKLVMVWLTDRDGMPAVGEEITWQLPGNYAKILGFLEDTDGVITDPQAKVGTSVARLPTDEEAAKFELVHGYPCHHAVAGVVILGTSPGVQSTLVIEMFEREGVLIAAKTLDFENEDMIDPELTAGLNSGIYEGPVQSVVSATSSIANSLVAIWWQDSTGAWHAYQPGAPAWANDLSEMAPGNVYWVNLNQNCMESSLKRKRFGLITSVDEKVI